MKALVEYVARSLADHPEQIVVREVPSADGLILHLEAAQDDIGKLIGKQGRTARASCRGVGPGAAAYRA